MRARNYNPQIARFTQEDMYRGDGLNLYAYCANNAVVYIDPSGYATRKLGYDRAIFPTGDTQQEIEAARNGASARKEDVCFVILNTLKDNGVNALLEEHGVKGVWYINGRPDFSPFSLFNVKIDNMTDNRDRRDGNFIQIRRKVAEAIVEYEGNINKLMENNIISKNITNKTKSIIKEFLNDINPILLSNKKRSIKIGKVRVELGKYITASHYVIHEVDLKNSICQIMPFCINEAFDHVGGVSDYNELQKQNGDNETKQKKPKQKKKEQKSCAKK